MAAQEQAATPEETSDCLERIGIKKGVGGYPRLITMSIERVEGYVNNPLLFPSIMIKKLKSDGSTQCKLPRTDYRRNLASTLQALLKHMDIDTLKTWNPNTKSGYTVESIALTAKMKKRSVERALQALQEAGLISSKQVAKQNNVNEFTAEPSIKQIHPSLFELIGMKSFLLEEQKKRQNGTLFTSKNKTRTDVARFNSVLNACNVYVQSNHNRKQPKKNASQTAFDAHYKKSRPNAISSSNLNHADYIKTQLETMNENDKKRYSKELVSNYQKNGKVTDQEKIDIINAIRLQNQH